MLPGTGREAGIHGVVLARVAGRVGVGNVATDGQINIFQTHKYIQTAHMEISPLGVLPVMRRRQAS